jgi:hypothetical protein
VALDVDQLFQLNTEVSDRVEALQKLPLGPGLNRSQIKQNIIRAFAESSTNCSDARNIVCEANNLVLAAFEKRPNDIQAITINQAVLPNPYSGFVDYWLTIFDHACMLGPRMVGALLLVAPPGVINRAKVDIVNLYLLLRN